MLGESQFTQLRKDGMKNIIVARDDENPQKVAAALASVNFISNIYIAERVSQLSLALNRNDEIISAQYDRIQMGEQLVERLIALIDEKDESTVTDAEQWFADLGQNWLDGNVEFNIRKPGDAPEAGVSNLDETDETPVTVTGDAVPENDIEEEEDGSSEEDSSTENG